MGISNSKVIIFILFFLSFLLAVNFSYAANLKDAFGNPLKTAAGEGAGYDTSLEAEPFIGKIITTALTFVGVLFLILAIYGGFIWMMARGNEQEVEKAKQIIQNSIIGLVVVLTAYAISWYVINTLGTAALKQTATPSEQIIPGDNR